MNEHDLLVSLNKFQLLEPSASNAKSVRTVPPALLSQTITKRLVYPTGDVYEGETLNNLYHGIGVYAWRNGDRYEGAWANNRREGRGIWIWGDESFSRGDRYSGEWHLDKKHGQGAYHQANGDVYEGEFKEDKRHGNGIYRKLNGESLDVTYNQDELTRVIPIPGN